MRKRIVFVLLAVVAGALAAAALAGAAGTPVLQATPAVVDFGTLKLGTCTTFENDFDITDPTCTIRTITFTNTTDQVVTWAEGPGSTRDPRRYHSVPPEGRAGPSSSPENPAP